MERLLAAAASSGRSQVTPAAVDMDGHRQLKSTSHEDISHMT